MTAIGLWWQINDVRRPLLKGSWEFKYGYALMDQLAALARERSGHYATRSLKRFFRRGGLFVRSWSVPGLERSKNIASERPPKSIIKRLLNAHEGSRFRDGFIIGGLLLVATIYPLEQAYQLENSRLKVLLVLAMVVPLVVAVLVMLVRGSAMRREAVAREARATASAAGKTVVGHNALRVALRKLRFGFLLVG